MRLVCKTCQRYYDDARQYTDCPHALLGAEPPAYCREHDLFYCPFHTITEELLSNETLPTDAALETFTPEQVALFTEARRARKAQIDAKSAIAQAHNALAEAINAEVETRRTANAARSALYVSISQAVSLPESLPEPAQTERQTQTEAAVAESVYA